MPEMPPAKVSVSRYSVSCLAEDHPLSPQFTLYVSERRTGRWAVTRLLGKCLAANGSWDTDLSLSVRPAGWEVLHHFDLSTALRLAKQAAAQMEFNGQTAADVLAQAVRAR